MLYFGRGCDLVWRSGKGQDICVRSLLYLFRKGFKALALTGSDNSMEDLMRHKCGVGPKSLVCECSLINESFVFDLRRVLIDQQFACL
jgi:hypothetical protein